jgi:hypothetical protein
MGFAEDALFDGDDYVEADAPVAEEGASEADKALFPDAGPEPQAVPQVSLYGGAAESDGPPDPEHTSIPLAAHLEERRKRQEAQDEVSQLRQERAALAERARIYQEQSLAPRAQQAPAQQAPQDPEPDRNEDPDEHREWQVRELGRQNELLRNGFLQGAQRLQQIQRQIETDRTVQQSRDLQHQFATANTDYYEAIGFLEDSRSNELAQMGYDQEQIQRIVENEKGMIVGGCMARDAQGNFAGWTRNPAEAGYAIAIQRGWGAANGATAPAAPAPQAPNSVQPTAAALEISPRMEAAQARAETMRAAASMGNSNAGSSATTRPMDAGDLLNMPDSQFRDLMDKNPGLVKQLLGG